MSNQKVKVLVNLVDMYSISLFVLYQRCVLLIVNYLKAILADKYEEF